MSNIKKVIHYGSEVITLETGGIARQASGAVFVISGDTRILVTLVGVKSSDGEFRDFLPLTVNYQEKAYANGQIPGGFLKREGRPSVREILICRLIDRSLRPLFHKGFFNEVQVIATVMSLDPKHNPDVLSMIGASAALAISGLPFKSSLGAARIGYREGNFMLNPSPEEIKSSELDLVVSGTKEAVLMVESSAKELSEEVMLQAVFYGHQQMQVMIDSIEEFAKEVNKTPWDWKPPVEDVALKARISELASDGVVEAYAIPEKGQRHERLKEVHEKTINTLLNETKEESSDAYLATVKNSLFALEKRYIRERILDGKPRIDGRDQDTVRPLSMQIDVLPRTHGSALFTRGETQVIVVTTLGTDKDARIIDDLTKNQRERFMLHYNFPPYCVGEVNFMGAVKRREIGHGNLAKSALSSVMPDEKEFPYVVRIVSETTESNGSSSMATICGSSLSLMQAGVPLKSPVAGIALGLISEGEKVAVLTDILGDEDHLGDMDFKVAGTNKGVTALQMDIKVDGITEQVMSLALTKARAALTHILEKMASAIQEPRQELSPYAPKFIEFKIPSDKIREVIGRGGSTIRELTEKSGAVIDVSDDATIKVSASDRKAAEHAERLIKAIVEEKSTPNAGGGRSSSGGGFHRGRHYKSAYERGEPSVKVGEMREVPVVKIIASGAFVGLPSGRDGFLHISEIRNDRRVYNIHEELQEGQVITVKVVEIDSKNRVRVSMKRALEEEANLG